MCCTTKVANFRECWPPPVLSECKQVCGVRCSSLPHFLPLSTSSLRLSLHWHIFYSACFVGASRNPSKIESSWSCRDKRTHVPPRQNVTLLKAFVSRQTEKKKNTAKEGKKNTFVNFSKCHLQMLLSWGLLKCLFVARNELIMQHNPRMLIRNPLKFPT